MKFLMNKALFLDMDGTIIETKSGKEFPIDVNDWRFKTGILPKIKKYSDDGYIIIVVSNQGGIELGYTTEEIMIEKFNKITTEIEDYIRTDCHFAFCPDMESYNRKPNPGLAYEFAIQLNLDLKNSLMVGDANSDKGFAENASMSFEFVNDFIGIYN